MKLPASHLRPTSAAAAPVAAAMRSLGAALLAASVLSSQPLTPSALAAPPTAAELSRIAEGLARIDYLLDNWDALTTVCKGYDETAAKQLTRTTGDSRCTKSPLRVQQFIGAASTLDPLFKADKLMIKAVPLVDPDLSERYNDAVDAYITKQQMSSTMAYTSSWSGIENPNGNEGKVEEALLETKNEVKALRNSVNEVVTLLNIPRAPPMKWGESM
eukprot:Transcript_838.p1 GENE.Transcript_838~~Transcript_838.p1  ORF type:complete len:216 (-),score=86.78 Transcript_838:77-724(-)